MTPTPSHSSDWRPLPERVVGDLEAIRVLLDPIHMRIASVLRHRNLTAREIAQAAQLPAARIRKHLRRLLQHELVLIVGGEDSGEADPVFGLSAQIFLLDRSLLSPSSPQREEAVDLILQSVLLQTVSDVAQSARTGVIDLEHGPPHADAMIARRMVVPLTTARYLWLQERLQELLAQVNELSSSDEGSRRDYAVVVTCYPSVYMQGEYDETAAAI